MSRDGKPLNGEKSHPLSEHAKSALRSLSRGAYPTQETNPGIVSRLCVGGYATTEMRPSPYATRKGTVCSFLMITDKGRALVAKNFEGET